MRPGTDPASIAESPRLRPMSPRVFIPALVQGFLATFCIAAQDMSGWKASQPVELPAPGIVRRETQPSAHAIGIVIDGIPQGDVLQLAVDDGDNARLPFSRTRVTLPRVRVIFPNVRGDDLRLHYGNPEAHAPRYDVQGLSRLLLDEVRSPVEVEPASVSGRSRGASRQDDTVGSGGWLLWVGLGAVVVVLLLLMRAFLPKATTDGEG